MRASGRLGDEFESTDRRSNPPPAVSHEQKVDESPFLAGEDPASDDLEDVEHWIKVYAELVAATHDLKPTETEGSGELDEQLSRMISRLEYWLKRRTELTSGTDAP